MILRMMRLRSRLLKNQITAGIWSTNAQSAENRSACRAAKALKKQKFSLSALKGAN